MNWSNSKSPCIIHNGGLAHFGVTMVFWFAAGVGMGRSEANHGEHLV